MRKSKYQPQDVFKIIYPSLTEDELSQFNNTINDWFIEHRDNESIQRSKAAEREKYIRHSSFQRTITGMVVGALTGIAYSGYTKLGFSSDTCLYLIIASLIFTIISIYIENTLVNIYSENELQSIINADDNIKDMYTFNPLDFTIYEIPDKKFNARDFSKIRRVHKYTMLVRKLLWLQNAKIEKAVDISIENGILTFTPIAGKRKLVPLTIDTKAASIYNNAVENIIDLTKVKTKIYDDVSRLNDK